MSAGNVERVDQQLAIERCPVSVGLLVFNVHVERRSAPHQRLFCCGAMSLLLGNAFPYFLNRLHADRAQRLSKPRFQSTDGRLNGFYRIGPGVFPLLVLLQIIRHDVTQGSGHNSPLLGTELLNVLTPLHRETHIPSNLSDISEGVVGVHIQPGIVTQSHLRDLPTHADLEVEGLTLRPHIQAQAWRRVGRTVRDNVCLGLVDVS